MPVYVLDETLQRGIPPGTAQGPRVEVLQQRLCTAKGVNGIVKVLQ